MLCGHRSCRGTYSVNRFHVQPSIQLEHSAVITNVSSHFSNSKPACDTDSDRGCATRTRGSSTVRGERLSDCCFLQLKQKTSRDEPAAWSFQDIHACNWEQLDAYKRQIASKYVAPASVSKCCSDVSKRFSLSVQCIDECWRWMRD